MTVPCKSDQSKRGGDGDRLPEADRSRRENDNNTFPAEAHQHKQKGQPRRIGLFAFYWCRREESNPRPSHYECAALPTELHRLRARTITDRAPGFKCCAAFFELTCFGQITPLSQSRDTGLVASQVATRPSGNIADEINFSSYIYFLGLVHYTARQTGAEETSSNQNATPGVHPRQPRHSSSATAQCQHPNTLRYSRALPLAGPVFLAFAFIGHAALTKCAISLVAGERNLLSVPNFLARSTCAVASNCPNRHSLPSDTLRP